MSAVAYASAYCDQTVVCKLPLVEMSDFHFSCLWLKWYLKKKKKCLNLPLIQMLGK